MVTWPGVYSDVRTKAMKKSALTGSKVLPYGLRHLGIWVLDTASVKWSDKYTAPTIVFLGVCFTHADELFQFLRVCNFVHGVRGEKIVSKLFRTQNVPKMFYSIRENHHTQWNASSVEILQCSEISPDTQACPTIVIPLLPWNLYINFRKK